MKNTIECPACGFASAVVKANAKGALSVSCSECGYQAFARSPKAVAALQKKLGALSADQPAGRPAEKPAGTSDDDWLKKL